MADYRVLVTGSRSWTDTPAVWNTLMWAESRMPPTARMVVVHGDCPTGADRMAHDWVEALNDPIVVAEPHPADWKTHGKKAGPLRNREMVNLGADIMLAFPLGKSPGTRDCIRRAEAAGIPVKVFEEEESR